MPPHNADWIAKIWKESTTLEEAARKLGMSAETLYWKLLSLRKKGFRLKRGKIPEPRTRKL